MEETTVLFRPVGQKELDLIQDSKFTEFPPRLPHQPIFYPVLNEQYATQIARDWNAKSNEKVGYVTRFHVRTEFLKRYEIQTVGGSVHQEYWIPAEDLAEFNQNIVGVIEVRAEYRNVDYGDTIQPMAKEVKSNEQEKPCVGGEQMSEAEIDYNVMGTFPASDPPSWTLGVRPHKTCSEEFEGEKPSPNDPSHKNEPEE